MATTSASSTPISPSIRACISPATAASRDEDGYYWITGRVDDVINVSGHRMGTAEVESALVCSRKVAESAVVGYPHDIKGQGIYAYVTLNAGEEPTRGAAQGAGALGPAEIGPIAQPDVIQWAPGLPKTRSGKIMRRILRKIAENDFGNLGDTSTLAEPQVVEDLIENRQKQVTLGITCRFGGRPLCLPLLFWRSIKQARCILRAQSKLKGTRPCLVSAPYSPPAGLSVPPSC